MITLLILKLLQSPAFPLHNLTSPENKGAYYSIYYIPYSSIKILKYSAHASLHSGHSLEPCPTSLQCKQMTFDKSRGLFVIVPTPWFLGSFPGHILA